MRHFLENLLTLIAILIGLWIVISYILVIAHNTEAGYQYPIWNFFQFITTI